MNQEISSQEFELQQVGPDSPQSLSQAPQYANNPGKSTLFLNIKRCALLLIVILASSILVVEINGDNNIVVISKTRPDIKVGDFQFLVYCPQSYADNMKKNEEGLSEDLRRRLLTEEEYVLYKTYGSINAKPTEVDDPNYDATKTYVVVMTSMNYTNSTNATLTRLFYCGIVRQFNKGCEDAFYACSSPGPMFDLQTDIYADVIWINLLNSTFVPDTSGCMDNTNQSRCRLMSKTDQTQTYKDPTAASMESKTRAHSQYVNISKQNWPVSTHVHGSEVRPTFDGNPLSWIDNTGQRGVGAFSLVDKCYYDKFDNSTGQGPNYMPPKYTFQGNYMEHNKTIDISKVSKVNRYPNKQNPGNLWYHDHAMRLTQYNVQYGLAGLYMLRNPQVERQIGVDRSNQKLIMMTVNGWQKTPLTGFKNDIVYRFRFLNSNFNGGANNIYNISFSYKDCSENTTLDQRIDFSIIGADSSLFNQSIDKQKYFFISQAQRVEILIKFSGHDNFQICSGVLPNATQKGLTPQQIAEAVLKYGSHLHDIQNQKDESIYNIPIQKKRSTEKDLNNRTDINNVKLPGAEFVNLATKPDSQIAVKRMRPLIRARVLTINGRNDYHRGKSQNPVIGTTEDWYIINTMGGIPHPIHIHLINFQVVKQYTLRKIKGIKTCSIYQLQFLVQALGFDLHQNKTLLEFKKNVTNNGQAINYTYLCDNKDDYLYSNPEFDQNLQKVNVENKKDSNRVSGIDVRLKATPQDQRNFKNLTFVPQGQVKAGMPKFVTDNGSPPSKPYYARWKDTAYVQVFQVLVFRMRWARSGYKEKSNDKYFNGNEKYFNVPADQLRQFPGYVYHCHILGHQDNEMMRSIMLQLPDDYKLNTSIPCNKNNTLESKKPVPWSDKYQCINRKCLGQQ